MSSHIGDVRDLGALSDALADSAPNIVFHFAAQSLVRASYEAPLETYSTNVLGTATLLHALGAISSAKVAIVATSDKCYLNTGTGRAFREDDPLGGTDHYSASKAAAEHVAASFSRTAATKGLRSATVRAGNVIGGGDWGRDRLLPDLMRSVGSSPAKIRYPNAVRPWQHVLDCLHGYMILAEQLSEHAELDGAWNFGPDATGMPTVADLADEATRLWPDAVRWEKDDLSHPFEAPALTIDATKARKELGWQPLLGIHEALEWTIAWHRRVSEGCDARDVTSEQLGRYESLLGGSGAG